MARGYEILVGNDCRLSLFFFRRHFGFSYRTPVGSWIVRGSDTDTIHRVQLVVRAWMLESVPSWTIDQVFAFHGLEAMQVEPVLSPDSSLA